VCRCHSERPDPLHQGTIKQIIQYIDHSKIEFLSFNKLNDISFEPEQKFVEFARVFSLDEDIADCAIQLRRSHATKLPDAVIAATALNNDFDLITRNEQDFIHIPDLKIVNPFSSAS
jgi:predicted nucleic acid-binding protein